MREIKFRAWHKILNKMVQVDAIDFSGGTIRCHPCVIDDKNGGGCFLFDNLTLMEYTGLTDRNGQEIYEGDLLWRPTVNRTIYLVDFNNENYGWLMGWNLLEYGIIDDKNNLSEFDKVQWSNNTDMVNYPVKSYYYGSSPDDHYEVVGNIFEGVNK